MKKRGFGMALLAGAMLAGTVMADHEAPLGSVNGLGDASRNLVYQVQYSYLRPNVKQAVFSFDYAVQRFTRCVAFGPGARPIYNDHDLVPGGCEYNMRAAQSSFYSVDRYLYDVGYDYPQVYQAYREAKRALRRVMNEGDGGFEPGEPGGPIFPGPGPRPRPRPFPYRG